MFNTNKKMGMSVTI